MRLKKSLLAAVLVALALTGCKSKTEEAAVTAETTQETTREEIIQLTTAPAPETEAETEPEETEPEETQPEETKPEETKPAKRKGGAK